MIRDIITANEEVTPNEKELKVLRENFPSCFKADGSFDIKRFEEYLSDKVDVSHEGYELRFLGKNYARMLASLDTETVIVPDEEHNNLPENQNSENIYISGDNLDGLKHLLKSYAGKVKCIYIDPACGTGGMLIEAIRHIDNKQTTYGKIYGQENNLSTSAIARMNLFLHGANDFKVAQGDTLRTPKFIEHGQLQKFNCVLANPPFGQEM